MIIVRSIAPRVLSGRRQIDVTFLIVNEDVLEQPDVGRPSPFSPGRLEVKRAEPVASKHQVVRKR